MLIDVQRLLEEEREDSAESGWKVMNKSELAETWRKAESTQNVHLIKVSKSF